MAEPKLTADRVAFLIALAAYLPDGEPVPVSTVAEHFGVSDGHVRRAVRLIAVSGVPGETANYQHGDLFDIDWDALEQDDEIVLTHRVAIDDAPRLSAREAAALIAGLQAISILPELADSTALPGLAAKLARGATGAPTAVAVNAPTASSITGRLVTAITDGRVLSFDYRGADGRQQRRTVDPLRLESIDADAYLRAWCHLREAPRTFRLDRIADLVVTDRAVAHSVAEIEAPTTIFSGAEDGVGVDVTVEFDAGAAGLLADYLPLSLDVDETRGRARAVVTIAHPATIWRLVAEVPGAVVTAPDDARADVARTAAAARTRYRKADGPARG